MENPPNAPTETSDRKEISVLIALGVIVIVCICCLLAAAGYALYSDISTPLLNRKTPTRDVVPVSTGITFSEDFDSNRNGWDEGFFEDEYGTIEYTVNGLFAWDVVAAQGVSQKSWASSAPSVEDFAVTVESTHVSGADDASYGVLFRIADVDNLYYFCISDVGYYYAGLLQNGEWTTLIDWTETRSINVNSLNTLKVVGEGDEFIFYVNETMVDSVRDSTHLSGTAGLSIELYNAGDVSSFEFDNFVLTSP